MKPQLARTLCIPRNRLVFTWRTCGVRRNVGRTIYSYQCSISGVLSLTWYTLNSNAICEVLVTSFKKKRRLVWRSENNLLTFPLNSSCLHSWWKYFLFLSSFSTGVIAVGATNIAFYVHRMCCTNLAELSGIAERETECSRSYGLRTQTGELTRLYIISLFFLTDKICIKIVHDHFLLYSSWFVIHHSSFQTDQRRW
jgi:hypothetical protein